MSPVIELYAKTLSRISERNKKGTDDLVKSFRFITGFIKNQNDWLKQSKEAFKSGFYQETISISLNQINVLLRITLWIHSQVEILKKYETPWMDSYLFDVLLNLNNRIGGKINDRDLYKEAIAQKIIIPSKRTRNLEDLFNERNIVFHKLFISGSREVESPELKKLAHEYLHVTKECFEELKKKDDELEIELKKMSERGKNLEF